MLDTLEENFLLVQSLDEVFARQKPCSPLPIERIANSR